MLHASTSARTLAFARIWIFAMCWGDVVREPTQQLVGIPFAYVVRIGPLALLPPAWFAAVYTPSFLVGLKLSLAVLLLACVAGVPRFRAVAVAACLLLTVHHALVRSVGHLNHGELAMVYGAYILAVSPSADRWSLAALGRRHDEVPRSDARYAAPMVWITLVFCLTYTFTGAHRLAMSGPGIFVDGSAIGMVLQAAMQPGIYGHAHGTGFLTTAAGHTALTAGFIYTTIFEILAPVCLFWPRFRWVWVLSIVGMHVTTWLVMQLLFFHNLVLMPLVMLDLEWWRERLQGPFRW